mmetsp:Transcript_117309/g.190906  ORF Transcript_117309/g.190906 Transcript_117309/m.190906 type:complete len:520 (+) Transcript_117309:42-1601(+)
MKSLLALCIFTSLPHVSLSTTGFLKKRLPKSTASPTIVNLEELRAEEVRDAIRHLWAGYKEVGWGADVVGPISGAGRDIYGRVGMFIIDTLDTLWLAGLHNEFADGEKWVSELRLDIQNHSARSSFFEMTIRGLGGLLSAYALSGHHVFLEKATLLGDRLLQAFPKPGSSHLWPAAAIDVHNVSDVEVVHTWNPTTSFLAEAGSNVLEFDYLSDATANQQYQLAAESVLNRLVKLSNSEKETLAPLELDPYSLTIRGEKVSVGAAGDSYYEYLLKRYLQSGCTEQQLLSTWKDAMRAMRAALLGQSADGLTYIKSEATREAPGVYGSHHVLDRMEHLACFVGGMLAIASHYVPTEEVEDWWLPTGIEITRTCFEMYKQSSTGLAPETVYFEKASMHGPDQHYMRGSDRHYRLRPETLESLFYLHRITGNTTYREWSWTIFQAINNKTKTKYGFAEVYDVLEVAEHASQNLEDSEETWMGAETLKYALLTQLPTTALPLEKFVFNTEAHPLPSVGKCIQT